MTDEDQEICLDRAIRRSAPGVHAHYRNVRAEQSDAMIMRHIMRARKNNRLARADYHAFLEKASRPVPMGSLPAGVEKDMGLNQPGLKWTGD